MRARALSYVQGLPGRLDMGFSVCSCLQDDTQVEAHRLLEDRARVADVVLEVARSAKDSQTPSKATQAAAAPKLIFKRRLFR